MTLIMTVLKTDPKLNYFLSNISLLKAKLGECVPGTQYYNFFFPTALVA